MTYKILGLLANHTCNNIKYNISLNNIKLIHKNLNDICVIDTINIDYGNKLCNHLKKLYKINNYFFIENNSYFDFGKWIYALKNIDYSIYDYILLINDSIILSDEINNFFNSLNNVDNNINLYGYNDSSQIKYHYQSYLFAINIRIVNKFINFIESKKNLIFDLESLVHNIELNLCEIDENHDSFIKIGNKYNKDLNLYWENERLYKYLLTKKIFSIIKLKKIFDIQKEYKFILYKENIEDFNYNFYREYYNINNLSDKELLDNFIEYGQYEGKKYKPNFNVLLPNYYRDFLNNLGLLYFFDVPEDFDIYYYKQNNTEIMDLSLIDTIFHYINDGYHKKRKYNKNNNILYSNNNFCIDYYKNNDKYKFNNNINNINNINNDDINDFNPEIYKSIYDDLQSLNDNELISHYLNIGIKENRIYKIPDDFDPEFYKNIYDDLKSLNDSELISHYLNNGIKENRSYKIPDDFDLDFYKTIYDDLKSFNDNELISHYLNNGIKENRIYKKLSSEPF